MSNIKTSVLFSASSFRRFSSPEYFILIGLFLSIFSIPFAHTKAIRTIGLIVSFLAWLIINYKNKKLSFLQNPAITPITIFFLTIILSLFTALDTIYTLKNIYREFLQYSILFLISSDISTNNKNAQLLFRFFLLSNILTILVFLIHLCYLNFNIVSFMASLSRGEFLSNGKSHTSTYFLFTSIFSLIAIFHAIKVKHFILSTVLLCFNVFFLLMFDQRGALLAFIFSIIAHFYLFGIKQNQKITLYILAAILLVFFTIVATSPLRYKLVHENWDKIKSFQFSEQYAVDSGDSVQLRIFGLINFVKYLQKYPLKGVGYGRKNIKIVEKRLPSIDRLGLSDSHNIFLNTAIQLGIQGVTAFLLIILVQFICSWKAFKISTSSFERYFMNCTIIYMVGFWIRMCFSDIYRSETAINYWLILGIGIGIYLKNRLYCDQNKQ